MSETKTITCVACPKGCEVTIEYEGDEILDIRGNACPQGADYAREEFVAPTRVLPTTVAVENGALPLVPVKTTQPISLEIIHDAMKIIGKTKVKAPVKIGQVIVKNILETGADVVATRDLPKKVSQGGDKIEAKR
ncbi:MAG: DUF1667 domain-containing protein [Bacillota bacterium]